MITKFRPIRERIGLSDKEDLYVTAGDPMAIKNMCEWAVGYIWNTKLDKLESKRVYVKGGELCPDSKATTAVPAQLGILSDTLSGMLRFP